MSKEVSTIAELNSKSSPTQSSLFDDAYDAAASAAKCVKDTVVEHPYISAAVGLAATAGLAYLTKGRFWGAAAREGEILQFKVAPGSQDPLEFVNGAARQFGLPSSAPLAEGEVAGGLKMHKKFVFPEVTARDPVLFSDIRRAASGDFIFRSPADPDLLAGMKRAAREGMNLSARSSLTNAESVVFFPHSSTEGMAEAAEQLVKAARKL